jgi:K+-sensing histidine kinase KdpD
MVGVPFITYYPAIVIAALVCGFWPGMLTALLSAVLAWYLFVPTVFSFGLDKQVAIALLVFPTFLRH